ncbi:hypothetical protein OUZ56_026493 [Daphnia magna]|uniref:Ankyrin repeat domain-containing protein n=1 Tax=Daphnia magna TaxID=35525 RepID=A0ABQ9ZMX4_9CRUS|nr:hypothetical protein OUZ56_026493 [Daphnia magna]
MAASVSSRHKRRRIQKKLVTDSAFYEEDTEKYSSATASVTGASESNSGKNYSFPNNQFQDDFIAEVIDSDMNHSDAEPDSGSDEEIYYVDCEKETETFYEVEADEIFFDCKEYNINKCELRESLASWAVQCQIPQCHVDQLLVLLKSFSDFDTSNLPKSGRTLLKTIRRTPIKVVGPGHYYHCGVEKADILRYQRPKHVILRRLRCTWNIPDIQVYIPWMSFTYGFTVILWGGPKQEEDGQTIAHKAAAENNKLLIRILRYHQHKFEAYSCLGEAPLMVAITCGHEDVANYLWKSTNVAQMAKDNSTVLHYAAKYGYDDLTRAVCEKKPTSTSIRRLNQETIRPYT